MRAVWLIEARSKTDPKDEWEVIVCMVHLTEEAAATDVERCAKSDIYDYRAARYVPAPAKKKGRK